jgi:hypothetical protein
VQLLARSGITQSAIQIPHWKRVDWLRRNPGVAASRQSTANFRREFKWRLSPEIRYAEDGLIAHAVLRIPNSAPVTALFLNSFWDGRLGQLAVELEL